MLTLAAFQAFVLGILEGLTEFLPVSSTGHLIIAGDLLNFNGDTATAFKIVIQLGAILAVMWEFRERVIGVVKGLPREPQAQRFALNVLVAFIPAVILGLLLADTIEHWLFNPITVATALIIGGFIMLWAEKREHTVKAETVDDMTWQLALKVGLAQCLALIPGTSRSGSTIIGGLLFGLSRKAATDFSFFLAMPTMVAATVYSLWKYRDILHLSDLPIFAIGFVTTFIVAMLTVRALLKFIASHSYAVFAWYRIAFGLLILATWYFGIVDWSTAQA
ncbi:undecaprenyl-diphosphate phosphatase [Kushneria marisflavi]|uniref:Undecaprenyl-diphosphatase n=1 Tax=Kushneria marisflavi TaxID=157779 RepID=A0A240US81_9GAMM|nr:undecaprenyl-diphosphate phosphatase [Kushneria marisflavi]ART64351.1 undecaprenyl-diphosphatase [Kushneria marisflavi]RKD76819.1 undecaprenyl-diphosphatase [Kushneria marisflavi]